MARHCILLVLCSFLIATSAPAADITRVTPRLVVAATPGGVGGTLVTVQGRDLDAGMLVALTTDGGRTRKALLSPAFDDRAGTIAGRVPNVPAGTYDVVLYSRLDVEIDTLPRALEVALPPRLLSVEPDRVSRLGGTHVIIKGENLDASTEIRFGLHPIANGQVNAAGTEISGIAPALAATEPNGPYMVEGEDSRGMARLPNGVTYENPTDPRTGALAKLRGSSKKPPKVDFSHGLMRHVRGRFPSPGSSAPERAKNFIMAHADLFGLVKESGDPHIQRVSALDGGFDLVRFGQSYRGIPVRGGGIVIVLNGSDVLFTVGRIVPASARLDAVPRVTQAEAETIARKAIRTPSAMAIGQTQLQVLDVGQIRTDERPEPTLAWRVSLAAAIPMRVYVDAISGDVIRTHDLAYESGGDFHGFDYDLYDAENEATAPWTSCFELASNPHAASENGYDNGYGSVTEAKVAHTAVRETYRYYHERMNRHSYDDDSAYFEAYFNSTAPNAMWVPWPCNLFEMRNGFADQEVVTHELTHGIIRDESDLTYEFQSGALNEHYADVMAVILDRLLDQAAGNPPDWTLAENRTSGAGAIRNMNNPPRNHWSLLDLTQGCSGTYDNGGVHCNSGIANQCAYLMVEGGTVLGNFTAGGLNLLKLMHLKYMALKVLPDDATFMDARNAEVAIADLFVEWDLHGVTPQDVCRVKSAWAVVGRGAGDFDCDGDDEWTNPDSDGDEIPDSYDNCDGVQNPTQANMDYDMFGDACDNDIDGDGWPNDQDGCPTRKCLFQWAPCWDYDFDGVADGDDNCPEVPNASQADWDEDFLGDACEPDTDEDGVDEDHDNCPKTPNPGQENADGDFFGDACDKCPNVEEIGAFTPWGTPFQPDSDEDGIPDACDTSYRVNGRPGWSKDALKDGGSQLISIEGLAGKISAVPFDLCPGGDCPEWYDPAFRFQLHIEGGKGDAAFWVSDGEGNTVARSAKGAIDSDLVFQPRGGEIYTLNVYFKKAYAGGLLDLTAHLTEFKEPPVGTQFRRADSNGDGVADITDVVRTLGYLFLAGAELSCKDAADSNDDGVVDITDGVFTISNLFLGGSPIPAPGSDACGLDPTPGLGCDAYPGC